MRQLSLIVALIVVCRHDEIAATTEPPFRATNASALNATYLLSDGFGYVCSLVLHKDGSFAFVWTSDTGLVSKAQGEYSADSNGIRFVPASNSFRQDPFVFTLFMNRIRWGARDYLVGDERLLDFVNAINGGGEPRDTSIGVFYLQAGDEAKQVRGYPVLPGRWNEYLLPAPVTGAVVSVRQRETHTQRPIVVINRGSKVGLRVGMKLFASNPDRPHFKAYLTLTEVQENSATAIVPFQYNHVRRGDRVSSRDVEKRPSN